jgi:hypothetical protein
MSGRGGFLALATCAVAILAFSSEDRARAPLETSTSFLRFVEGKPGEGRLETGLATYEGEGGVQVDLIGAVHVGDAAYYRRLQRRFEDYEALLYEMIKPEGVSPEASDRPDNLLSAFQRGLKNILGLDFQLDAIRYDKPNFVHADMDPDTFFRLQKEKGESILSLLWKSWMAQMKSAGQGKKQMNAFELLVALASDDSASALKLLFAREMNDMERIMAGFEGEGEESVIVSERNKVAMRVLGESLAAGKRKIGIFYGAGHMADLERRLVRDLGFRLVRTEWLCAWDVRRGKKSRAGDSEDVSKEPVRPMGEELPRPSEAEKVREF